jgi:hypothetical protein
MGFLVEWYCPDHGVIERHPDDGRDTHDSRGYLMKPTPSFGTCPWPWDAETGRWTYEAECTRTLRRRVEPDLLAPLLFDEEAPQSVRSLGSRRIRNARSTAAHSVFENG